MTSKESRAIGFDNQCEMCDHKQYPDGGHCYMFRQEPVMPCGQHTVPVIKAMHTRAQGAIATIERMQSEPPYGLEPWENKQ